MTKRIACVLLLVGLMAGALPMRPARGNAAQKQYFPLAVQENWSARLKWAYGGCYSSWCETGWYSSPAVVDVNNDGRLDIVASAYSVFALDGISGDYLWPSERRGGTSSRTWPGIVVADLDRDGAQEIVVAQSGGKLTAYTVSGDTRWVWNGAGGGEFRGLLAADVDGNGSNLEVIVTRAAGGATNTWVLNVAGGFSVRDGWPQLSQDRIDNEDAYAWGVYNANAAVGNLLPGNPLELVVPSDVHYINAYAFGKDVYGGDYSILLPANATTYPGRAWGKVGVWESLAPETRGWGACDGVRSESYRANFADGPAVIADVDGNGQREVVVVGNMYDCSRDPYRSRYYAPFIFNADRTRWSNATFDWSQNPLDTGAPLSENYNQIESAEPNPVVADLDGDGRQEILFASYDGRMHAFWLDKTEHADWPYAVTQPGEGFLRFASEPVVADLFNDGAAEVIFTSWAEKGSGANGKLHVLEADGSLLFEDDLPAPKSGGANWNGALAAPTLANVDDDADLEVILNTAHSGVVVYDLPGTNNARVLWSTGRGNLQRTAGK